MDGFSAGVAAMTHFPGATVDGLPTPATIGDYAVDRLSDRDSQYSRRGERLAHWVDLDEYVVEAKLRVDDPTKDKPDFNIDRPLEELRQEQALMLRPAIRPEDATRYIVAIRNVRDGEGSLVEAFAGVSLRCETARPPATT